MEASLYVQFNEWDQLQQQNPELQDAREEKDRILRSMREVLSDRTYVSNMVNDLLETTG